MSKYYIGKLRADTAAEKNGWPILVSLLLIALIILLGKLYSDYLGLTNIGMLFLLPVVLVSTRMGILPSIAVALASVLCFDMFFVPPLMHLRVNDPRHLITFLVFMLVAYTTGNMADLLRYRMREALQRENQTRVLYELARDLSAVADLNTLARQVVAQVAESMNAEAALYLPDSSGDLRVSAASKALSDLVSGTNDLLAAQWTFENIQPSGLGTDTFIGAKGFHVPVRTEDKTLGVLGVKPLRQFFNDEEINLLQALAGLSALAIVRLELVEETHNIRTLEASERLRAALFNSISHDMKTPLASILGAVSSLVDDGDLYSEDQKATLLNSIKKGALRMDRFINNLLDMARLESGYMQLHPDWFDIQDIIGVTLRDNHEILTEHVIKVDIPDKFRLVWMDYALVEQVLTNLLHNAVKFSPPGSEIIITVTEEKQQLVVSVADQGVGIAKGDEELIFDKFYRLQSPNNVSGTGLGLSICRGIIEAHGGKIWAENLPERGSRLSFSLPIDETAPQPEERLGEQDYGS